MNASPSRTARLRFNPATMVTEGEAYEIEDPTGNGGYTITITPDGAKVIFTDPERPRTREEMDRFADTYRFAARAIDSWVKYNAAVVAKAEADRRAQAQRDAEQASSEEVARLMAAAPLETEPTAMDALMAPRTPEAQAAHEAEVERQQAAETATANAVTIVSADGGPAAKPRSKSPARKTPVTVGASA